MAVAVALASNFELLYGWFRTWRKYSGDAFFSAIVIYIALGCYVAIKLNQMMGWKWFPGIIFLLCVPVWLLLNFHVLTYIMLMGYILLPVISNAKPNYVRNQTRNLAEKYYFRSTYWYVFQEKAGLLSLTFCLVQNTLVISKKKYEHWNKLL